MRQVSERGSKLWTYWCSECKKITDMRIKPFGSAWDAYDPMYRPEKCIVCDGHLGRWLWRFMDDLGGEGVIQIISECEL